MGQEMLQLLTTIEKNWAAITLMMLVVITFLSLWPLDESPSVPGTDKTHHLIAYALLMLPTAIRKPKNWMLLSLFFIVYSGGIELLQPYVNRYAAWMDLAANAAGIGCGLLMASILNMLIPVKRNTAG